MLVSSSLHQRVLGGETADLIIGSIDSISSLVKEGRIAAETQMTVCKVGVGIVVPSETPHVQMRSIGDLKRAIWRACLPYPMEGDRIRHAKQAHSSIPP